MGVLSESDWKAGWLGAPGAANTNRHYETMLLRREFAVKSRLERALAHVCGLGQYELFLNGVKAGDDLLSPGSNRYDKTCLYDTRDITALLRQGNNAIGLLLGNGMYNVAEGRYTKFTGSFGPLKAIVQVRLDYADGTTEILGTDEQWRLAPGPITFSSVYGGEDYDARLEPPGWNEPGFADARWERPALLPGPGGELRGFSHAAPPLRAMETLRPMRTNSLGNNLTVYDLGQNAPIMVRLQAKGPPGSWIRVVPAELLKQNGSVNRIPALPARVPPGGNSPWPATATRVGFPSSFIMAAVTCRSNARRRRARVNFPCWNPSKGSWCIRSPRRRASSPAPTTCSIASMRSFAGRNAPTWSAS